MRNINTLENNEKMLIEAFKLQNEEAYDEAIDKLEVVGGNLIAMMEGYPKNMEFYMRAMPIMRHERELVSDKDYKEFIHKNEKVLSKNFEKNAYLALLMQQMQQKVVAEQGKWSPQDEEILRRMVEAQCSMAQVQEKFSQYEPKDVRRKYQKMLKKAQADSGIKKAGSGSKDMIEE